MNQQVYLKVVFSCSV